MYSAESNGDSEIQAAKYHEWPKFQGFHDIRSSMSAIIQMSSKCRLPMPGLILFVGAGQQEFSASPT
jgi:hypothetical protein